MKKRNKNFLICSVCLRSTFRNAPAQKYCPECAKSVDAVYRRFYNRKEMRRLRAKKKLIVCTTSE